MATSNNNQVPTLLDYLQQLYKTPDLAAVNPLQGEILAPDAARQRTISLDVLYEGTPAEFQALRDSGQPIRLSIAQLVGGNLQRLLPNASRQRDSAQGVKPADYDIDGVIINGISLTSTINTFSQAVGVSTNGLPATYEEMRKEQLASLAKQFGTNPHSDVMIKHIPPTTSNIPDTQQMPLLIDVPASYHGSKVSKTFGGVTARHMYRGVIGLSPEQCMAYGIARPPVSHDAAKAPEGLPQIHNTWNIVPVNHVLARVTEMPADQMRRLNYAAYQLFGPNNVQLPFVLIDTWTIAHYSKDIIANALVKIEQNRVRLPHVYVEIMPLNSDSWLDGCMPGMHDHPGYVAFKLTVTYTLFLRNFRDNPLLVFSIPADFPPMIFRPDVQEGAGPIPDQQLHDNQKRQATVQ